MQKLRGIGTTFSTSGKHFWPFAFNPRQRKIATRNAKLRRLMRAGIVKPMSKEQMRKLIEQHIK